MRRGLLTFVCLVAAVLAISTLAWPRSKSMPRIVFSTGESTMLRRLTCGTNHLAPKPRGWPLPPLARSLLFRTRGANPEFHNVTTAEPSLVLWLEQTAPRNLASPRTTPTWLMIADETGHAAGKKVPYWRRSMDSRMTVACSMWPRSSRKLTIRWFEEAPTRAGESGSKLVGEWIVENPAYQPPALRVPERLPLTQTNNSLRCTLEHAFFGLATPPKRAADASGHPLTFSLAGAGEETAVVLVPRITSDSPGEKWEVASVVLRDISDNQVMREPLWLTVDETYCSFAPALWPAASWEVNVFAKRHVPFHLPVSESFSPEELLVFKDVELTGPGERALGQELGRIGARLRLTQFTLRPPQNLSEPWSREDASELRATLSRSADATVHLNLAGVTDDEGKPHYPRAQAYATAGLSRDLNLSYSFPTLPLGARKLTITFVVQRGREFTFRVKPEIPSSPVSLP